jgi:hypothetical protein
MIKKHEEVVPLAHNAPLGVFIGKGSHSIHLKQCGDAVVIHRKDIPKVIRLLEALKAKFDYEDRKSCGSCKFAYRREQPKRGGWYGCSRHTDASGGHKSLGTWQMRHESCVAWEYNGEGSIVPPIENAEMMNLLYGSPLLPEEPSHEKRD